jgi:hypothetical protein
VGFEHAIQLFDGPESLGDAVARFFVDGLSSGDNLLMVAKPLHIQAVADAMSRRGVALASLADAGRIAILDAATTLRLIMKRGVPDIEALKTVVENTVDSLMPDGQQVRVYGELVEILAEEGNFPGVDLVEGFWNGFGATHPISLLCGYSSAHFVMPGSVAALESICAAHNRVQQNRQDLLANWLLSRRAAL